MPPKQQQSLTWKQSAALALVVSAVSWAAVAAWDGRRDLGIATQRDLQQDRDIQELRAWRNISEQTLRNCQPARTDP